MVTVDITPHPRILQVLGEIEFKPYQSIAELVDNSIDEFIRAGRRGSSVDVPTVRIAFGRNTVVVKDNGPGMTVDALQSAVRAGWTSNERIGNLGLYGVGFNIATARLGAITTIWTTRNGDSEWYGLELNLKKMARGESFILDVKTRTKTDSSLSGTEVEVTEVKPDWRDLFQREQWIKTNISERLARIYGTMLRGQNPQPISFNLYVNDKKISAWEHCVWPSDWTVFKKSEGDVRPIFEIDEVFGKRYLSLNAGEFLDSLDGVDEGDVIELPERVYGWIGIQRYADTTEYGIDILRHGRKIEIDNKDVFKWEDDTGKSIPEYPIDDPRNRGRIVGEIHLDHGYVHYTKHRFEREHSSWSQLLLALRKNEPLTNRKNQGLLGVNESPLGTLFRVFRRNSPTGDQKHRDILFLKDNDQAKKWAEKWRKGVADFRSLEKWQDQFTKDDAPGPEQETEDTDEDILIQEPVNLDTETAGTPPAPQPVRTALPQYSFRVTDIGSSGKSYNFESFSVEGADALEAPWRSKATPRGVYEIEVSAAHPAFNSTSLRPIDAILAEMSHLIASEELASSANPINFGDVLFTLRTRFSGSDSLDINRLILDIEEIRQSLADALDGELKHDEQRELVEQLPPDDKKYLELAKARGSKNVGIVSYLRLSQLLKLINFDWSLLFKNGRLNLEWTPESLRNDEELLESHRESLVRDLSFPLSQLAEFAQEGSVRDYSQEYLFLIRGCINRMLSFMTDQNGRHFQ